MASIRRWVNGLQHVASAGNSCLPHYRHDSAIIFVEAGGACQWPLFAAPRRTSTRSMHVSAALTGLLESGQRRR